MVRFVAGGAHVTDLGLRLAHHRRDIRLAAKAILAQADIA